MSLAADVAMSAAERVERSAGPAPALAVFRRLAASSAQAELRARATLGGLRCAMAVRDLGALHELALLWRTVDEGLWEGVFETCRALSRAGLHLAAFELASVEVERLRTARALYLVARLLDVAGDRRATDAFRAALERADNEGATALGLACRVRLAAWLATTREGLVEAIELARNVPSAGATDAEHVVLARVLLRSPSRFVRAGALGLLDTVVSRVPAGLALARPAREAVALAARHADDRGDDLTPMEVDRLLALFSRDAVAKDAGPVRAAIGAIDGLARARATNDESAVDAALAAAAAGDPTLARLHARARDILAGRFEPASVGAVTPWSLVLDAVVGLRDRAFARAAQALRALAEASERAERLPPVTWTLAQAALQTDDTELRAVAGRLAVSLLERASAAPPRGYLPLAQALAVAGMTEPAERARRSAANAREPGAVEALVVTLTRSAWQSYEAGERSPALARLREARALAGAPTRASSATAAAPSASSAGSPTPARDPAANRSS